MRSSDDVEHCSLTVQVENWGIVVMTVEREIATIKLKQSIVTVLLSLRGGKWKCFTTYSTTAFFHPLRSIMHTDMCIEITFIGELFPTGLTCIRFLAIRMN